MARRITLWLAAAVIVIAIAGGIFLLHRGSETKPHEGARFVTGAADKL